MTLLSTGTDYDALAVFIVDALYTQRRLRRG